MDGSVSHDVQPNDIFEDAISPNTHRARKKEATSAKTVRLDSLITDRGEAESRQKAQGLILAGAVRVNGTVVSKAGHMVDPTAEIVITRPEEEYVGRGAFKLVAALDSFGIDPSGLIAVDVGASTGGFTDVLLRRGVRKVYAIDVGYGQLAWRIRQDPRVVTMERVNFRLLDALPEPIELAVVDVSFISLRLILPALGRVTTRQADAVALIKPQFEAGRQEVGKGGVVRDPEVHRRVLDEVLHHALVSGWRTEALIGSPVIGPAGNREFLVHLKRVPRAETEGDIARLIDQLKLVGVGT